MNKCEVCGKECKGKTCSGAHRAELSRRTRTAKVGAQMQAHSKAHESAQTAPSTQNTDEQEAAQSTKLDGSGQCIGVAKYAAESQPSPRIAFGIDQPTKADEVVPELEAIFGPCDKASLQHYIDCPDMYVSRREPERMNWGKWLDADQLKARGFKCNRTPLLGDWDYAECVPQPATAITAAAQALTSDKKHDFGDGTEFGIGRFSTTPQPTTAVPVDESKAEDNDPLGRIHSVEEATA